MENESIVTQIIWRRDFEFVNKALLIKYNIGILQNTFWILQGLTNLILQMENERYCSPVGDHASEDERGFFGEEMNAFSIAWIATAVYFSPHITKFKILN